MRTFVALTALFTLGLAGTTNAQPAEPQYSADDLVREVLITPAPCPPDRTPEQCAPDAKTRGFRLVAPPQSRMPSAVPARTTPVPAATVPTTTPNATVQPTVRPATRVAPAPRPVAAPAVVAATPTPTPAATPAPTARVVTPTPVVAAPARPAAPRPQVRRAVNVMITFAVGSAELTPQGLANMQSVAAALNKEALLPFKFEIAGYTDITGDAAANMALSQRRAEAVRAFLISRGVAPDRLTSAGYGPDPLADAENPTSQANRRVELHRLN